jgi:RNA polymerase primary sigma factor
VLLVADECHRYGAKTFTPALQAEYAATLGLSATPERSDLRHEEFVAPALGDIVYRLGYREALAHDVISEFDVCFVALSFTAPERGLYDRYSEEITDRLDALRQRYPELEHTELLFEQLEVIFEETNDRLVRALQGSVSRRQQVLHGASARMGFVEWLFCDARPGGRTLLFHERIEECEELAATLNALGVRAAAHHSGLSKTERQDVLRGFRRGFTRAVVAPRTLDEGIDVPDADLGVIVAGSKRMRQRIQRAGRVLRKTQGKDAARVFVLYIEHSVEDPRMQRDADGFVEAIEELGRAYWYEWPRDSAAMGSMTAAASATDEATSRADGNAEESSAG